MTAEEVNRKYHISIDKIRYYEENGLLQHNLSDGKIDYTEAQIHCAGMIHSLLETGMDMEKIKVFMKLFYENKSDKSEQIKGQQDEDKEINCSFCGVYDGWLTCSLWQE